MTKKNNTQTCKDTFTKTPTTVDVDKDTMSVDTLKGNNKAGTFIDTEYSFGSKLQYQKKVQKLCRKKSVTI